MTSFAPLARDLAEAGVRYVIIGVSGVNLHAHDAGVVFSTMDRDLYLPLDSANLLTAWSVCEARGLRLTGAGEPLDEPRDIVLAERVVERRSTTRADDELQLSIGCTKEDPAAG